MKIKYPSCFSVGWSRVDITPHTPTPLDGMGKDYERQKNWVWPEKEQDRLKADLILIADGQDWSHTVVICTMDTLFIHEMFSVPGAKTIAKTLRIPENNVLFCASHTHSGVSMDEPDPSVTEYLQWLYGALEQAAMEAARDMAPAGVKIGSLHTVGMNAQRRYILKDGSHHGTVFDQTYGSEDIAGFETTPDPTLRAIRFTRQEKADILLVNWQMHPGFAVKVLGAVSADFIGTVRECFEKTEPDCHFAFIQGAAGNMGRLSRWQDAPGYEKAKAFDRDSYATEFVRLLREEMTFSGADTGTLLVRNGSITVKKRVQCQVTEENVTLPLNTVCFGDIAFATAPAEVFSDIGLAVRKASSYKMTFFCGCTNGNYGYLPIMECFEADPGNISFEVRVSKCEPGTGEKLGQKLIQMLTL